MYAITFDLTVESLEKYYPGNSYQNAYMEIRTFLQTSGFEWKQGSVYFGNSQTTAVDCVRTVQKISLKYPWFPASVRDIRMLRIEEMNDLLPAIQDIAELRSGNY